MKYNIGKYSFNRARTNQFYKPVLVQKLLFGNYTFILHILCSDLKISEKKYLHLHVNNFCNLISMLYQLSLKVSENLKTTY